MSFIYPGHLKIIKESPNFDYYVQMKTGILQFLHLFSHSYFGQGGYGVQDSPRGWSHWIEPPFLISGKPEEPDCVSESQTIASGICFFVNISSLIFLNHVDNSITYFHLGVVTRMRINDQF